MPNPSSNSDRGKRLQATLLVTLATMLFLWFVGDREELPPMVSVKKPGNGRTTTNLTAAVPPETHVRDAPARILDRSHRFQFARENVLGTSFDLTVIADNQ